MGEIIIELYWKHAPITCRNFAELARRGYYNGTKFHRIIRDFMIQGKIDNKLFGIYLNLLFCFFFPKNQLRENFVFEFECFIKKRDLFLLIFKTNLF